MLSGNLWSGNALYPPWELFLLFVYIKPKRSSNILIFPLRSSGAIRHRQSRLHRPVQAASSKIAEERWPETLSQPEILNPKP